MNKNPFKSKQYATSKIYRARPQEVDHSLEEKPNVPQGIMTRCPCCGKVIYTKLLLKNLKMCDDCNFYFKVSANERIAYVLDEGELEEFDKQLTTKDPLAFPGYADKLLKTQKQTGLVEGLVTGKGKIEGLPVCIGVMDSTFFMGSMGTAIGEKLARIFEQATKEQLPVIVFTASGGARMQEGIFSLMQMAKVSGAVARHGEAGLLYITVLTNPTTGGVTASFAMLGDIILAEPGALIGFAGPRVIEQTIGQKLPEGFQRAEFLLEHGFVDAIVSRVHLKATLGNILKLHLPEGYVGDDNSAISDIDQKSDEKEESSLSLSQESHRNSQESL